MFPCVSRFLHPRRFGCWAVAAGLGLGAPHPAAAQSLFGATLQITRAQGEIRIDGDLSDEGWRGATRVDRWFEIQPGDNTEPAVKSLGFLTYDDRFLYIGFEFDDPNPPGIRAPLGDHDAINGNSTDFGGVFLDAMNTGNTATEFFVNPRNVQYDAIQDDTSGENSSPDFFWDSATKITDRGWNLEIRIPFSSLRYRNSDPQTWGIILFRNYPRGFRYQFLSTPMPRGGNCFVCRENRLAGLEHLPAGGHVVAAPYVSATANASPVGDELGQPLVESPLRSHVGLDVKYTPNADNALDLAVKPDFSQVESDTAQITANERFALFFPEKRPFFLEGVELFQTPLQAVYTRTITSPDWGGRVTGKDAGFRYTMLVAQDSGGGTAVLPGPTESSTADQNFSSTVFIGRVKRDIGLSSIGALFAARESTAESAHNIVGGPDFQWRASPNDLVSGQWLFSGTKTPNRPDLADEWTGQAFDGGALLTQWSHSTRHLDWSTTFKDIGRGFRAETGFIPQVGFREESGSVGWTVRPSGVVSRQRTFLNVQYQTEPGGRLVNRELMPGFGMDTRLNGFVQLRYIDDRTRAGDIVLPRRLFGYIAQFSPSRRITYVSVDGTIGQDIDFVNARGAHGTTVNLNGTLQPTNHLELALLFNTRWLDVNTEDRDAARLITQRVERVKGTYTFTSRMFVRVIAQYVDTTRDLRLFTTTDEAAREGTFGGSALFAYKLNWQSVLFVGYGDDRELSELNRLERLDRQVFLKISYAFQR